MAVLAVCITLTPRKTAMNYFPATFGFSETLNAAGLEFKTAMLQFSQQIRQYQMDCINNELADYEAATKHQKSPRDMAQSQKLQMDLAANQYARFIHYWTGLTQVMLQGTTQLAMAVHKCGVDTTHQLSEQTGATTPSMPEYVQSVMDSGMGYAMASFDASQRYARESAHAVLDSAADHATNGAGKHSKSGAHAKHNSRHGANGAAA